MTAGERTGTQPPPPIRKAVVPPTPPTRTRHKSLRALMLTCVRRRSPLGRGQPPSRSKQLAQGKGLRRGSRLSRQAPMPRGRVIRDESDLRGRVMDMVIHGDVFVRSATGFPPEVRSVIVERDRRRCQRCGTACDTGTWPGYSLQHRDNRAMGGSSADHTNRAGNGIILCGSATTGCHGWVESHPRKAMRGGWSVASWADPTTVPVHASDGWVQLDHSGGRRPVPEPEGRDAHAVAARKEAA